MFFVHFALCRCLLLDYWLCDPPRKKFDRLHLPILCVVLHALAVCLSSEVCSTGSPVNCKLMHILMREKIVDQSYQEKKHQKVKDRLKIMHKNLKF